jgi:hypothetical protein
MLEKILGLKTQVKKCCGSGKKALKQQCPDIKNACSAITASRISYKKNS